MVLRDSHQDTESRKMGDNIELKESPVYREFHRPSPRYRPFIHIPDTWNLIGPKGFRERAKNGRMRSILAFPLRVPAYRPGQEGTSPGTMITKTFRGFLSVDAPVPNAFDEMFHDLIKGEEFRDLRDELHAFFGIADSLATIVMLKESAATNSEKGT
jgi:hypothetical protein